MQAINIRRINAEDVLQLQLIGRITFEETFASENSNEDMQQYLAEGFAEDKLRNEILNDCSEFYFAEENGKVIGYLKLNIVDAQTENKTENALEIERIYVLKEFHGSKIGQLLLDKAIAIAKNKNVDFVWLGVWEENPRAIRFYEKNGFVVYDQHIFKLGEDEQTDLLMKLPV